MTPLLPPTDVGLSLHISLLVRQSVDTFHHTVLSLHLRPELSVLLVHPPVGLGEISNGGHGGHTYDATRPVVEVDIGKIFPIA